MARMYPPELPPSVGKPPKPSGPERRMFELFERHLDDSWASYYSFAVAMKGGKHGIEDDETDFALVHPEHGIVCVEVKGRVRLREGRWEQQKDEDSWRSTKDPGAQAASHLHMTLKEVRKKLGWPEHEIRISRLVCVTGRDFGETEELPSNLERFMILDKTQVNHSLEEDLLKSIAEQRSPRDQTKPPGEEGVSELHRRLFAPSLDEHPDAATQKEKEQSIQVRLTEEQARGLEALPMNDKVAVVGCAGSGKTLLAMRAGKKEAEAGKRVLFTCFNESLADDLSTRGIPEGMTVRHFHGLCRDAGKEAALEIPPYPSKDADQDERDTYFWMQMPMLLDEALDKHGREYDVVIVDEAQDFHPDAIEMLREHLADDGQIWIFLDDSQEVYLNGFEIPEGFFKIPLNRNCRNTRAIQRAVNKYYSGGLELEEQGPDGLPVEFYPDAEDQAQAVAEIVEKLIDEDCYPAQDVVVLSLHNYSEQGSQNSAVARAPGKYEYVRGPSLASDKVRFSSFAGFKGLEASVVVLCEMNRIRHGNRRNLLYVAMSRARNRLIMVGPLPDLDA